MMYTGGKPISLNSYCAYIFGIASAFSMFMGLICLVLSCFFEKWFDTYTILTRASYFLILTPISLSALFFYMTSEDDTSGWNRFTYILPGAFISAVFFGFSIYSIVLFIDGYYSNHPFLWFVFAMVHMFTMVTLFIFTATWIILLSFMKTISKNATTLIDVLLTICIGINSVVFIVNLETLILQDKATVICMVALFGFQASLQLLKSVFNGYLSARDPKVFLIRECSLPIEMPNPAFFTLNNGKEKYFQEDKY